MKNIKFSQEDITNMRKIIETHEGELWSVHQCVWDLRFCNKDATAEFWLSFLFNEWIVVRSVTFMNKWTETFTEVMAYCEQFAKNNRVSKIVIQSVGTDELSQWCRKYGYKPNPSASVNVGGFVFGDYEKDMDAERKRDENREKFKDLPIKIGDKVRMNASMMIKDAIADGQIAINCPSYVVDHPPKTRPTQHLYYMVDHPDEVYTVERYDLDSPDAPYILSGAMSGYSWGDNDLIPV